MITNNLIVSFIIYIYTRKKYFSILNYKKENANHYYKHIL